jgi:hypothetical protein
LVSVFANFTNTSKPKMFSGLDERPFSGATEKAFRLLVSILILFLLLIFAGWVISMNSSDQRARGVLPRVWPVQNGQSLINQESHQPASECAIMTEPWWVARRSEPAIPYS